MGRLRIMTGKRVAENMDRVLDELKNGPVFVARENRRVTAVMLEISDYYDLLGELEDMMELIRALGGGCDCGCEDEEECSCGCDSVLDGAFREKSD